MNLPTSVPARLSHDARLLQGLVGSTVVRAILEIWPSLDWPEAADTRLFLETRNSARESISVLFAEDSSAMAIVEPSVMESEYTAADLASAVLSWKTEQFWSDGVRDWCRFSLEDDTDFGWLIGATIERIELVCLAMHMSVLGYLLHFGNGKQIWSTPGTEGNWVRSRFSKERMENWELVNVSLDQTTMHRQW